MGKNGVNAYPGTERNRQKRRKIRSPSNIDVLGSQRGQIDASRHQVARTVDTKPADFESAHISNDESTRGQYTLGYQESERCKEDSSSSARTSVLLDDGQQAGRTGHYISDRDWKEGISCVAHSYGAQRSPSSG